MVLTLRRVSTKIHYVEYVTAGNRTRQNYRIYQHEVVKKYLSIEAEKSRYHVIMTLFKIVRSISIKQISVHIRTTTSRPMDYEWLLSPSRKTISFQ